MLRSPVLVAPHSRPPRSVDRVHADGCDAREMHRPDPAAASCRASPHTALAMPGAFVAALTWVCDGPLDAGLFRPALIS
jgi:hypothetical protein